MLSQTHLVTGAAGFIGMHLCLELLRQGHQVIGVDNFNDYYEVSLKFDRIREIRKEFPDFLVYTQDVALEQGFHDIVQSHSPDTIVHLAAQAGVRYSLENPQAYGHSNLRGTLSVLEAARHCEGLRHLVMASSSSVYGLNDAQPYKESHSCEHPLSLYAATKKAGEMMAHSYAHNFSLPITNLRFFTVYGPWGRPDMGLMIFANKIAREEDIEVFNYGEMTRAFTYVSDIVRAISALSQRPPTQGMTPLKTLNPGLSSAPYRVLNIGGETPVGLMDFIKTIEARMGRTAKKVLKPLAAGDMVSTVADCSALESLVGFKPKVGIEEGVDKAIHWYKNYYGIL